MALPAHLTAASDGSLLLTGGAHGVLGLCTGDMPVSAASVAAFWDNHARRLAYCQARDIRYQMVVFPEKLVPFAPLMPEGGRIASPFLRDYAKGRDYSHLLYPKVSRVDYLRTDTHLSVPGMRSVTKQIVAQVGIVDHTAFDAACAQSEFVNPALVGDLGGQCDPPISEEAVEFLRLGRGRFGSNRISAGNFGIIEMTHYPRALTDQTLLLFGNSFFRQTMKCLTHYFSKIFFLRTRFFHDELVAAIKPDLIFAGCAERYLAEVEPDSERPHALSFPLIHGRASDPSAEFAALWELFVDSKRLASG